MGWFYQEQPPRKVYSKPWGAYVMPDGLTTSAVANYDIKSVPTTAYTTWKTGGGMTERIAMQKMIVLSLLPVSRLRQPDVRVPPRLYLLELPGCLVEIYFELHHEIIVDPVTGVEVHVVRAEIKQIFILQEAGHSHDDGEITQKYTFPLTDSGNDCGVDASYNPLLPRSEDEGVLLDIPHLDNAAHYQYGTPPSPQQYGVNRQIPSVPNGFAPRQDFPVTPSAAPTRIQAQHAATPQTFAQPEDSFPPHVFQTGPSIFQKPGSCPSQQATGVFSQDAIPQNSIGPMHSAGSADEPAFSQPEILPQFGNTPDLISAERRYGRKLFNGLLQDFFQEDPTIMASGGLSGRV